MPKKPRMGRPPKPKSQVRGEFVPVRVTKSERRLLVAGAKVEGEQVSVWLREVGLKEARRLTGEGEPPGSS